MTGAASEAGTSNAAGAGARGGTGARGGDADAAAALGGAGPHGADADVEATPGGPRSAAAPSASASAEGGSGAPQADGSGARAVPAWAVERDAERTSKFVALKGLDSLGTATDGVGGAVPGTATDSVGGAVPGAAAGRGSAAVPRSVPAASPGAPPAHTGAEAPPASPAHTGAEAPPASPAHTGAEAPPVSPGPAGAPPAPLDLLAELTNTPAPPETPRRTVLRRVKVWTPVLLLLLGVFVGVQLLRPLPAPRLVAAESVHTLDGQFSLPWPARGQGAVRVPGSGDIGTFGEQKPVPTASVAKVMTAYVILKGHPLGKGETGPSIEVDAKAVADGTSENESRIEGLTAGTAFSQQDMLKMLMIPSGNNIARLLARWDTGSATEAAFVAKMNAAARELGMKDTTYTDPSGLDAGTVSTAVDQLKLAEAVMKDAAFRAVVSLPNAEIEGLPQPIYNNNDSLLTAGLSIRGIKTGSSTPAGGTLMWAAYKSVGDETPLILGTLMEQRAEGPDPNATRSLALVKENSRKIIEAVRQALASAPVIHKDDTVGYVDDGLGGRTPLVATKDVNVIGVPGQQLRITLGTGGKGGGALPHSAKAGTEVGVLTVGDGDGARSVPVAVGRQLAQPAFGARLTRLG